MKFVLLGSCPRCKKDLKGRDTVAKQSESSIWIHSRGGGGHSQGRQRHPTFRPEACILHPGWRRLFDQVRLFDWQIHLYSQSRSGVCPFPCWGAIWAVLGLLVLASVEILLGGSYLSAKPLLSSRGIPSLGRGWAAFPWNLIWAAFSLNLTFPFSGCSCLSFYRTFLTLWSISAWSIILLASCNDWEHRGLTKNRVTCL